MTLVVINTDFGAVVHDSRCADVKRDKKRYGIPPFDADSWDFDYMSRFQMWLDYNCDFLNEGGGPWDINFKPCVHEPMYVRDDERDSEIMFDCHVCESETEARVLFEHGGKCPDC